jgi:hypothetical protein
MLKGKKLYTAAREFCEEQLLPKLNTTDDLSEDEKDELAAEGANLGLALAIDIAESLHRISVKIG